MEAVRRRARVQGGFTLIEMMVVVIIMAIFAAFAVPSYRSIMTQNRMASELNDLTTDLELARSTAIREGFAVTICPSLNPTVAAPSCTPSTQWNTGWIVFSDTSGSNGNQTYSSSTGDVLYRVHPALQNGDSAISSATGGTTLQGITFNRMGGTGNLSNSTNKATAATALGYIELTDSTKSAAFKRCVSLTTAGTLTQYIPPNGRSCP